MPTVFEWIANQRLTLPLTITKEECAGKVYIVTGANVGLGYEAAKHLVRIGAAKVIIAVRNLDAGTKASKEIEQDTGLHGITEVWPLDLTKSASVRAFAERVIAELDRIDGIVENAGVAMMQWTTAEGYETQLLVNVINTFLLAVLLLPKLSACANKYQITPHIVIVSSGASFSARDEFHKIKDDPFAKMNDESLANMRRRYPLSKLMEMFLVRQMALIAPQSRTGVVINSVGPGLCKTQLARNAPLYIVIPIYIMALIFGRTAEEGSRTLLHAVTAGKESHGCYLASCQIKETDLESWMTDDDGKEAQKRIWGDLVEILEKFEPNCIKRIM